MAGKEGVELDLDIHDVGKRRRGRRGKARQGKTS